MKRPHPESARRYLEQQAGKLQPGGSGERTVESRLDANGNPTCVECGQFSRARTCFACSQKAIMLTGRSVEHTADALRAGKLVTTANPVKPGGLFDRLERKLTASFITHMSGQISEAERAALDAQPYVDLREFMRKTQHCTFCDLVFNQHDPSVPGPVDGKAVHRSCAAQIGRRVEAEKAARPMRIMPDPYIGRHSEAEINRATAVRDAEFAAMFTADVLPERRQTERPHPWNSEDVDYE